MIEKALYDHLMRDDLLAECLAKYGGEAAIFSQEAPADTDPAWGDGPQYGRVVFAVDLKGDPERTMGGTLVVDISCRENEQKAGDNDRIARTPEEIEPLIRHAINEYFFTNGKMTVAAQWKTSSYFTQPTDQVTGCTVSFDLLAFPVLTTGDQPDVIERLNEWTASKAEGIHVINHDELPETAWKPTGDESAVYWRVVRESPTGWIRDTHHTIWRTATVKCHIFSVDQATATSVARQISTMLYAAKRVLKAGEAPIMTNTQNTIDPGADALRSGQLTVEATYGIIIHANNAEKLKHIHIKEKA